MNSCAILTHRRKYSQYTPTYTFILAVMLLDGRECGKAENRQSVGEMRKCGKSEIRKTEEGAETRSVFRISDFRIFALLLLVKGAPGCVSSKATVCPAGYRLINRLRPRPPRAINSEMVCAACPLYGAVGKGAR